MLSQLGCRVIASDISPAALQIAAERYARHPLVGNVSGARDAAVRRPPSGARRRVGRPRRVQRRVSPRAQSRGGARRVRAGAAPGRDLRDVGAGARSTRSRRSRRARCATSVSSNATRSSRRPPRKRARWDSRPSRSVCTSGLPHFVDAEDVRRHDRSRRRPVPNAARAIVLGEPAPDPHAQGRNRDPRQPPARRARGHRSQVDINGDSVHVTVENHGPAIWLQTPTDFGLVNVGAHLFDERRTAPRLTTSCASGCSRAASRSRPARASRSPPTSPTSKPGDYRVEFDLVAEGVVWFSENGNPTVTIDVSR